MEIEGGWNATALTDMTDEGFGVIRDLSYYER